MNDLNKALDEISSIREQVARSTEFRGYGPATLATTGLLAILAAVVQAIYLPDPVGHVLSYTAIWIATAVLCAVLIAMQTVTRTHRMHSGMADEMIRMAVEQFLPAAGAGTLLTIVLVTAAPSVAWMLPGLWQIVYSLGVFASCRFLPRLMAVAGAWYLIAGLTCIMLSGSRALSSLSMGITFGGGQLLVAGILYLSAKEAGDETEA